MRLHGVHIQDLRCISDLELEFTDPETGEPLPFVALVGAERMRFPRGKVLSFARDPDPFEDVYALVAEGHSRKALKPLYKLLDAPPQAMKRPEETDALLRRLDLERLDIKALVGVLTVTLHAHDKLPYRAELFEQIRERLRREAPDRVDALLEGLEA